MITGGKRVLLKLCHFRFAARWYSGTYFDSSTDCPRHDIAAARAEDRAVRHGLQGGCPTESIALSRRGSSSHGSGERLIFGARVGEASGHPKTADRRAAYDKAQCAIKKRNRIERAVAPTTCGAAPFLGRSPSGGCYVGGVLSSERIDRCGRRPGQRSRRPSWRCSRKGAKRKSMMRRWPVRISALTDMPGNSTAGRPSTLSEPGSIATCTV